MVFWVFCCFGVSGFEFDAVFGCFDFDALVLCLGGFHGVGFVVVGYS